MESEIRRYTELVKKRLASLRLMARELRECRDSFIKMDLESIRRHVSYQGSLCSEIQALDDELKTVKCQLAVGFGLDLRTMSDDAFHERFDAESRVQLHQLLDDLADTRDSVRRLKRIYAGMLKRSRHTIDILLNTMASYAGVYGPPGRSVWRMP